MTATAFAFDPVLESHDDPVVVVGRRPDLRVIQDPSASGGVGHRTDSTGHAVRPVAARSLSSAEQTELHRRRRFFALLATTALILAVAWASGVSIVSFPGAATPIVADEAAPMVHVVLPGDSYGAIAAQWGAADPVAAGAQLRAANGGAELVVGQRLVLDRAMLDTSNDRADQAVHAAADGSSIALASVPSAD